MSQSQDVSGGQPKVALVTGATGLVGRYLVMHLLQLGTWKVYAVSRGAELSLDELPQGADKNLVHVQVASLMEKEGVEQRLRELSDVTHIFHCAFHTHKDDPHQDVVVNLSMLVNVVEAVEAAQGGTTTHTDTSSSATSASGVSPEGTGVGDSQAEAAGTAEGATESGARARQRGGVVGGQLQHVYVQAGSKWYGQHLGKYKTPAKENDPRYLTPNFYYDMVDYCRGRVAAGAAWSWSSLLPNPVIGYSPSSFMNLLNAVAGYAVICRELGLPFRFPGSDSAYHALTECCDATLLAEAAVFVSTTPKAANQIFNVSNGDVFRWSEVWPEIARLVGLEAAPPQAVSLAELMVLPDKTKAWEGALQGSGLSNKPEAAANNYGRLIAWEFGDLCFGKGYDFFQSVTKLRQAGFSSMKLDSTDMWLEWLKKLDRLAVFPPVTAQAASNAQHSGVGKERAKGAAEAPAAPQIVPA